MAMVVVAVVVVAVVGGGGGGGGGGGEGEAQERVEATSFNQRRASWQIVAHGHMVQLLARSFANLPTTSNNNRNRSNSSSSSSSSSRWCDLLLKETVSPLLIWDDQMRQSVVRFVDTQTFDTVDEGIFLVVVVVVVVVVVGGGGCCAFYARLTR
jgi:uncharacterized Tic20 family protein